MLESDAVWETLHAVNAAKRNKDALQAMIEEEEMLLHFVHDLDRRIFAEGGAAARNQQEAFGRIAAVERAIEDETARLELAIGAAKAEAHIHSSGAHRRRDFSADDLAALNSEVDAHRRELRHWVDELQRLLRERQERAQGLDELRREEAAEEEEGQDEKPLGETDTVFNTAAQSEREAEIDAEIARYQSMCNAMSCMLRAPPV